VIDDEVMLGAGSLRRPAVTAERLSVSGSPAKQARELSAGERAQLLATAPTTM
jgi:hypothetical protein